MNFDNIAGFDEYKDGKLEVVYFVPNKENTGFIKKSEIYDCMDTQELIKTF